MLNTASRIEAVTGLPADGAGRSHRFVAVPHVAKLADIFGIRGQSPCRPWSTPSMASPPRAWIARGRDIHCVRKALGYAVLRPPIADVEVDADAIAGRIASLERVADPLQRIRARQM